MAVWLFLETILWQVAAHTVTVFSLPAFWAALLVLLFHSWMRKTQQQCSIFFKKQQAVNRLSVFLSQCVSVLQVVLITILGGWFAGILASIFLVIFGVAIDYFILIQLWCVTICLFGIRKHFVCFAYAGGVVALLQYFLWGNAFAGQQVLMLVAILHFTEAILVRFFGGLQATSVYLRNKGGRTIKSVQLQMIWPLPLVMPEVLEVPKLYSMNLEGYLPMPEWWPLFALPTDNIETAVIYQLIPMLAAIGYSDCTNEATLVRIRKISRRLILYSLLLGGIVLLCFKIPFLICIAAITSMIGHELITQK